MDSTFNKQIDFNFKTLPFETVKAFEFMSTKDWLKDQEWYLAGGTALALQIGHRKSYDLDFFTQKKNFENNDVLNEFLDIKKWKVTMDRKNTVYGELFGCKMSFIAYPFFIPNQKPIYYGSVKILAPLDIAVMKVIAISQRGRKRDFFDLYWCVHNLESLEKIMERLKVQYPHVVHDYHHILKALHYFTDAEEDISPEIYFDADWARVKKFFRSEVPRVMKNIMNLS